MKVELIVSIGLVAVGALIGAGFATGGAWLDTADKTASVISCILSCVAFYFAFVTYHSWKKPIQLEAYEFVLEQLELFINESQLLEITLILPYMDTKEDSAKFFSNKFSDAFSATRRMTTIPRAILIKLERMDPKSYMALRQVQEEANKLRYKIMDALLELQDSTTFSVSSSHLAAHDIRDALSSLAGNCAELVESFKDSYARVI
jgi:phosphate/sulfate permease